MTEKFTQKTGILLLNIGTPEAPSKIAIKRYLREFLSDPHVFDIPFLLRAFLLNFLILPFRSLRLVKAYQAIWTLKGSPLLVHSLELKEKLSALLGEIGMRYSRPRISAAASHLRHQGCQKVIVIPLFPQYSIAATHSAIHYTSFVLSHHWSRSVIHFCDYFFDRPLFIDAVADLVKQTITDKQPEMILMSYHGLPMRQISKVEKKIPDQCLQGKACPVMSVAHRYCYRAQCYATSRFIAERLNLDEKKYAVAFQSRLGKATWIQPYTQEMLTTLRTQGIKRLAVVCPSFVVDCLETLEEIGIRAREMWRELGGEEFILVPCVNATSLWLNCLKQLIVSLEPTFFSKEP